MSNNNMDLISLEQVFSFIPGNVFWKDRHNRYLGCNASMVTMPTITPVATANNIFGKTIHELLPHEYADPIHQIDAVIMQDNVTKTIEEKGLNPNNEPTIFLSQKIPLYNPDGSVIGLIGVAFDIADHKYESAINTIAATQQKAYSVFKEVATTKKNNFISMQDAFKECGTNRCYLLGEYKDIYLTKRELECIFYLAKGKTAKEIARELSLSFRTVEFYIKKIKTKLNCRSILELMVKLAPIINL